MAAVAWQETCAIAQASYRLMAQALITTLALNTRYHYAWVRDANGDRLYLNGKLEASYTGTKVACPASRIVLGASGFLSDMQFFNGFIQGVRISRVARYRDNFTPPQTYKAA